MHPFTPISNPLKKENFRNSPMSNPNPLIGEEAPTGILNRAAPSLPPPPAVLHLISIGVCVRCIFRFSGLYDGPAYSCSSLTSSLLRSFLEERNPHLEKSESESESESVCSVCLGILQFGDDGGGEELGKGSVEGFAGRVGEVVKGEGYGIDGFSLELSVPAAVMAANERALWLYMKRKYDCEKWLKDKLLSEHIISVKDALRLSVTNSLEKCLDAKSGVGLFCIRLTYTHVESSTNLAHSLGDDQRCKKRKVVTEGGRDLNGSSKSESDAAILKTLNNLEDDVFSEHIIFPPEKVVKPCHLTITCHRSPIYIGGRYLKFSRKVSQSRWIIDDERMGEASVEEIIGSNVLSVCRGDNYKFHAAGREDIDVRMLGSGRPFLIEVSNARCLSSTIDVQKITDTINNSDKKYVRIRNLNVVGSEIWALMREGEAEKQKQYAALVWITRPLSEEDIHNITSVKDMEILQRTPIRVLHRRSPLERKRVIHWMKVEKVAGSSQYFLLHLCTQAGTYIKEFVHGDLGRTHPSVGSILGCRSEILQLDVTDVKMDFFD